MIAIAKILAEKFQRLTHEAIAKNIMIKGSKNHTYQLASKKSCLTSTKHV